MNFVAFIALGKSYELISQKLHFPRLNSGLTKNRFVVQNYEECTLSQFWLIQCFGHQLHKRCTPLLDVQKSFAPLCCFSIPYCKGLWISKGFFCTNPELPFAVAVSFTSGLMTFAIMSLRRSRLPSPPCWTRVGCTALWFHFLWSLPCDNKHCSDLKVGIGTIPDPPSGISHSDWCVFLMQGLENACRPSF